ncbi:MAG: hypothetical protein CMI31_07690 [Opitutae bacterium]|nr:hypothetical protein [Opitutae bacterium]
MHDIARQLDDSSRRSFLAHAAKSALGVTLLPNFLQTALGAGKPAGAVMGRKALCDNVIFLYMRGGMSQVDTFDPKTDPEIKGSTEPMNTAADGLQFADTLPKLGELANDIAVIRSMTQRTGSHSQATYAMHTGYKERPGMTHPQLGSWAQHFLGKSHEVLPSSVVISGGNPGPGFLPPEFSPLPIGDPQKGIKDLLPKIDQKRMDKRVKLSRQFASTFQYYFPHDEVKAYSDFYDQTVKFFSGEAAEPFDISKEPGSVRGRYGNSPFGQGCLLARRLVERGVRYVEVKPRRSWDSMHGGAGQLPALASELDGTMSTLLADLSERGMLERTMVVVATEFGRTSKVKANGGRDHHPNGFSCALAGGGIKGGQAIGITDSKGRNPDPAYLPKDLHATIATALGMDVEKRYHPKGAGRPSFVGGRGKPIDALLG